MTPVIRVDNLSKRYQIRVECGAWSVKRRVYSWPLHRPRSTLHAPRGTDIWALRDVSFQVGPGEVVGILGRNGAGKSTLLKILSRVTDPTGGSAEIHGRLGSLLEVGTGFHPELTGRENVYLNGAILGMGKKEIHKKFDAIVAFADVAPFIDTPVKFYSSGMYLRLAFAVAAHLEPDILVLDEVLAVGDIAFQKKCLGKMEEVAGQGRTVLFVSHNPQAVRSLCSRALWIEKGRLEADGPAADILQDYVKRLQSSDPLEETNLTDRLNRASGAVRFTKIVVRDDEGNERWQFSTGETLRVCFSYHAYENVPSLAFYLALRSGLSGTTITTFKEVISSDPVTAGSTGAVTLEIPEANLRPGDYSLRLDLASACDWKPFDVADDNVGLPWIVVTSDEDDLHRNQGFFTLPSRVLLQEEAA